MTEVRINFRGWGLLLAIPLVAGLYLWRVNSIEGSLNGYAGEVIRQHIASEIVRNSLDKAGPDGSGIAHADSGSFPVSSEIEIIDSSSRGTGDQIIVKIVFTVGGSAPTDMENVRYFRLKKSGLNDWRVERECDSWSWWLKVL